MATYQASYVQIVFGTFAMMNFQLNGHPLIQAWASDDGRSQAITIFEFVVEEKTRDGLMEVSLKVSTLTFTKGINGIL